MFKRDQSVFIKHGHILFTVNYYTELLGVLFILSDHQNLIKNAGKMRKNEAYRNDVLNYFNSFKNNKVTRILELLSEEYYFSYDAPVDLFLQLSNGNKISREKLCEGRILINKELFNELLIEIRKFKIESHFKEFYESKKAIYYQTIQNFIKDYQDYDPISFLTHFLNIKSQKKHIINFMFGITSGNYGVSIKDNFYANIRPYDQSKYDDLPDFSYDPIYYTTLILHELAHSYLHPIMNEYIEIIHKIEFYKYNELLNQFEYGDHLEVYMEETIIRALECLYVKQQFPNDYEEYVQNYINTGFIFIKKAIDILMSKDESENINKYVGQIIDLFKR